MTCFEYYNPVRLLWGPGVFSRLGECLKGERRVLLVTGRASARREGTLDRARDMLRRAQAEAVVFDQVPPNPTDDVMDAGGQLARAEGCSLVLGLGGGSAMDAAKAIAVAATHDFPLREFLMPGPDGQRRVPTDATLPVVCVTTTSGTSSELTPFAVITTREGREKNALSDPHLYPRAALCDPELTYRLPPEVTASTGVDVLCHAVEGYISTAANPFTDQAAEEAIRLVGAFLPRAVADGSDREARCQMSLANVFAGVVLSNCGASIMHALEHPVSGHFPQVPHGAGLAALLVAYAQVCHEASPARFARVSALLGGPEDAGAAAETFEGLLEAVGMKVKLSRLGVSEGMLERVADDAERYMGRALEKTPGCPDRDGRLRILRASF